MASQYRMYVDETGTHGISPGATGNNRYLCLMGVIVKRDSYGASFAPELDAIKKEFFGTADRILHRVDIHQKTGHFAMMNDADTRLAFNSRMTGFYREQDYTLLAVAIDKNTRFDRYGQRAWHPYHYCAKVLFERYCLFLKQHCAIGDAAAEARNDSDNVLLQDEWRKCSNGGCRIWPQVAKQVLITDELLFKRKEDNVHGLQLADMLLQPALEEMLVERSLRKRITNNSFQYVCRAIYQKWHRKPNSSDIWQYGKVFLT